MNVAFGGANPHKSANLAVGRLVIWLNLRRTVFGAEIVK